MHFWGTFSFLTNSDSKQGKITENGWPDDASAFSPGIYRFDLEPESALGNKYYYRIEPPGQCDWTHPIAHKIT